MSYRKCIVPLLAVGLALSVSSTALAQDTGACAYPATNTCDPTQISEISCQNLGGVWQGDGWITCRDCDCDGILDATEVTDCVTACVDDPYTTFTEAQCLAACTDPDGSYDGTPNDCLTDLEAGMCCKASDGTESAIDDGVGCTDDACSYAWPGSTGAAAHGSATHTANVTLCYDGDVCTDQVCDVLLDCVYTNNTASCDDGLYCTVTDTCADGVCGGTARDCGDGKGCTIDTCDDDTDACVHTPDHVFCDDSDVCTDDVCDVGAGCQYTNNTAPCDDSDACTTADTCAGGSCVGGAALDCTDGNECTRDQCDAGTGCFWTDRAVTYACDDGMFCTDGDHCDGAGTCVGGGPLDCTAPPGCGDDTCDEDADQCVITLNDANCDDSNVCTDNVCTMGGCTYPDNTDPCDDADMCTTADTCAGGVCVGGAALDCTDGNDCTRDLCAALTGCYWPPRAVTYACDDGLFCTDADHCDGAGTCVGGGATDCSDAYGCTDDTCDDDADVCVHTPNDGLCDDSDVCTDNVCTLTGCTYPDNTAPCDDNDECTTADTCAAGACVGGPALDCDDDDVCTDDTCNWFHGCQYAFNTATCDDGNVCTPSDWCTAGVCGGHGTLDCTTTEPCDVESCDPIDGCQTTFQGSTCGPHLGAVVATGSGPISFLYEQQCFSVEVWVMDASTAGDGITCAYVDLTLGNWDDCPLTVEGWTMGPDFPLEQAGYQNLPEDVVDLGGCTLVSGIGAGDWVLLATLDVVAPADACTGAPIIISQAAMTHSSLMGQGQVPVTAAYSTTYMDAVCWGNLYNHSDNSEYINPGDLSMFATAWGQDPAVDVEYDYDCDGVVGPGDLSFAATAWLKGVCAGGILIPGCRLNCDKYCVGGPNDGLSCSDDGDCPDGFCVGYEGGTAAAMQVEDGRLMRVDAPPWASREMIESFGLTVPSRDWEGWRLEPVDVSRLKSTKKGELRSGVRER